MLIYTCALANRDAPALCYPPSQATSRFSCFLSFCAEGEALETHESSSLLRTVLLFTEEGGKRPTRFSRLVLQARSRYGPRHACQTSRCSQRLAITSSNLRVCKVEQSYCFVVLLPARSPRLHSSFFASRV